MAPVVLIVLAPNVHVVEQRLVSTVADLREVVEHAQGLVLAVLTRPRIARVEIEPDVGVELFGRDDLAVEVLTVPPEAGAHADRGGEGDGASIGRVAADESAQTAAPDAIGALENPPGEPLLFDERNELLFEEIQVLVALPSKTLLGVDRVGVLVVAVVGVPDPHKKDLPHAALGCQLVEGILHLPGSPECRLAVQEQVLTVVHDQNLVLLEGVVEVGGRIVEAHFARISKDLGGDACLVDDLVSGGVERREHLHDIFTAAEDLVLAKHPDGVIKKGLDADGDVFGAEQGSCPGVGRGVVEEDSLGPGEVAVVATQVDLPAAETSVGVVNCEGGVGGSHFFLDKQGLADNCPQDQQQKALVNAHI
jgi:hypothetical protein